MTLRDLILFAATASMTSAALAQITGTGRALDGDTLLIGSEHIRLYGIDAPEYDQKCSRNGQPWECGKASADRLARLIAGQQLRCTALGKDQYGRTLARCTAGSTDLNRIMVSMGYAVAFRRYSMDYVSAEESANLAARGIWSGTFEMPGEVRHSGQDADVEPPPLERQARRERPVVQSLRSQPKGNCRIKGNRSRRGELIYHLPGKPYYAQTIAEQLFCTEAEARAAGYRRSRADQHR